MISDILKQVLGADTSDNTDAATLFASFPTYIQSEELCPPYLFTCLQTLLFSAMPTQSPVGDLVDFISRVYGDADIPKEGGIYIREATYESVGDTPNNRGDHLDTEGAEFGIVKIFVRLHPPEEDSLETEIYFRTWLLLEQIDLRIQWLIDKTAREGRRKNNLAANPNLTGWLNPQMDTTLNSDYAPYVRWLKITQTNALETVSWYESQYTRLWL